MKLKDEIVDVIILQILFVLFLVLPFLLHPSISLFLLYIATAELYYTCI